MASMVKQFLIFRYSVHEYDSFIEQVEHKKLEELIKKGKVLLICGL